MNSLFTNTHVIELNDTDFQIGVHTKLKNNNFTNKDGYVMFYAPWCPNCQNKAKFWSFLGEKFNSDREFLNENFKIGAVNTEDSSTQNITKNLKIQYIPRFLHVNNKGELSDYKGPDHEPESLLSEVCQEKHKLCNIKKKL